MFAHDHGLFQSPLFQLLIQTLNAKVWMSMINGQVPNASIVRSQDMKNVGHQQRFHKTRHKERPRQIEDILCKPTRTIATAVYYFISTERAFGYFA